MHLLLYSVSISLKDGSVCWPHTVGVAHFGLLFQLLVLTYLCNRLSKNAVRCLLCRLSWGQRAIRDGQGTTQACIHHVSLQYEFRNGCLNNVLLSTLWVIFRCMDVTHMLIFLKAVLISAVYVNMTWIKRTLNVLFFQTRVMTCAFWNSSRVNERPKPISFQSYPYTYVSTASERKRKKYTQCITFLNSWL